MEINPINTNYQSINFNSKIIPSESLEAGFNMMERYSSTGSMKDMNSVKDFVDNLARISNSGKSPYFKIEIDRRRPDYTYTKINGRRVSGGHNEWQQNMQDAYLVTEGVKKYATKLEQSEESVFENLKKQIEDTEAKLDRLKERYSKRLKTELEQARRIIFNGDK